MDSEQLREARLANWSPRDGEKLSVIIDASSAISGSRSIFSFLLYMVAEEATSSVGRKRLQRSRETWPLLSCGCRVPMATLFISKESEEHSLRGSASLMGDSLLLVFVQGMVHIYSASGVSTS